MGESDSSDWQRSSDVEKIMKCPICKSAMGEPIQSLYHLPSVTSDCRPWSQGRSVRVCSGCGVMKREVHHLAETYFNNIYDDYVSYPEPQGRTKKILDFVSDKMPVPGSVLDIGTGTGDGLITLSDQYPLAKVIGYEPTIHKERPESKFDLITLFQVFEHVEDLHEMLAYIKRSLSDKGHLLIQVPYAKEWSFDLIVADHWWHFTFNSLAALLNQYRFKIIYLGNDVIKKEITVLATSIENGLYQSTRPWDETGDAIEWLLNFRNKLDSVNEPVVVMGTGPAAAWAGTILGDKVKYYVDDDVERQQKLFNGKRVGAAFQCDFPIVAPFPDWQLDEIKKKNPSLRFL